MRHAQNAWIGAVFGLGVCAALAAQDAQAPARAPDQASDQAADRASGRAAETTSEAARATGPEQADPARGTTLAEVLKAADGLEAGHRLGVRAGAVQAARRVVPVVVLVSDARSYVEAVAAWDGPVRYPVLWDDGTPEATADIERFVRAFAPERVVRWAAPDTRWPEVRLERQALLVDAACRAAGARPKVGDAAPGPMTNADLIEHAASQGIRPPGVVVAWAEDPAWPAGLALAAGRLQPLIFVSTPGGLSGVATGEAADAFAQGIEARIAALPVSWQELGDDIDAVTLCLNVPARARAPGADERDFRALTDRVGRHGPAEAAARWAWAGQVSGTEARAAYRAMSGLFVPLLTREDPAPNSGAASEPAAAAPRAQAWIFDAYESGGGWDAFDGAKAAAYFEQAGVRARLDDGVRQGLADWRAAGLRPLDASVVLVNTTGTASDFELRPGTASAGDVPVLARPTLVHFVHSFSAQFPGNEGTIAGRFLAHGAVAYAGSVHEPFLDAFVPTPVFAGRMLSGWAFGAAARTDHRGWWRIAVLGDPLLTFMGPGQAADAGALPLVGAVDLDEERRTAVVERDYPRALATLRRLGRTSDAARLAKALLESEPGSFTAEVAREAVPALFFAGEPGAVLRAFERLDQADRAHPALVDAMWHAARAVVLGGRGGVEEPSAADAAALMAANPRDGLGHADAIEAGQALARHVSPEAGIGILRRALERPGLTPGQQRRVERALREMGRQ